MEKHSTMKKRAGTVTGKAVRTSVARSSKDGRFMEFDAYEAGRGAVVAKATLKTSVKKGQYYLEHYGIRFVGSGRVVLADDDSFERVNLIRCGVPAGIVASIAQTMDITKERFCDILRFPRSSVDRKIQQGTTLTPEQSERIMGIQLLIRQVETMVTESGNPQGFDPAHWTGQWLERPNPALGGAMPSDFLDTIEGQGIVSRLLAQSVSGAYA